MVTLMPAGYDVHHPLESFRHSQSELRSVHMRSQSMPETVYFSKKFPAAAAVLPAQPPPVMNQKPRRTTTGRPVHLRRSHTNVAEFAAFRKVEPHYGSTQFLSPPPPAAAAAANGVYWSQVHDGNTFYLRQDYPIMSNARSRSNIAALYSHQPDHHFFSPVKRQNSDIFGQRLDFHRSLGFLTANPRPRPTASQSCRDLSQPLHVDCSVEYDLGTQPKIPRDSAPLLIIHPAYQNGRYHPYSDSSDDGLPRTPQQDYSCRYQKHAQSVPPKLNHVKKVSRHSSFLVPSMAARSHLHPAVFHSSEREEPRRPVKYSSSSNVNKDSFHLSMPDISVVSRQPPKAKVNLCVKLDASRKLSTESSGSSVASRQASVVNSCDSGLGTPSSLMDEAMAPPNRWKSSMSGLVSGFLCCSGLPASDSTSAWPEVTSISSSSHRGSSFSPSVGSHSYATSHAASHVTTPSSEDKKFSPDIFKRLDASPGFQIVKSPWISNPSCQLDDACPYCRSRNPERDCRDGFCATIWNKENIMRPIHI